MRFVGVVDLNAGIDPRMQRRMNSTRNKRRDRVRSGLSPLPHVRIWLHSLPDRQNSIELVFELCWSDVRSVYAEELLKRDSNVGCNWTVSRNSHADRDVSTG